MNHIRRLETIRGTAPGGICGSNLEPLNRVGCVGENGGINPDYKLEQVMLLAYEIRANIIIKAGKNAQWYLKRFDRENIAAEIQKQGWRDTSHSTTWIIEWYNN